MNTDIHSVAKTHDFFLTPDDIPTVHVGPTAF